MEAAQAGLVAEAETTNERAQGEHMTALATAHTDTPARHLTVADVMTPGVIHCTPDTPLRGVAHLMSDRHVHAVYVFDYGIEDDEAVEMWGLVSDLDLIAALPVIDERTAGNTAVTPLLTVSTKERLDRAAQVMAESGNAHLAVIDPVTTRPAGVLSTLDVARAVAAETRATGADHVGAGR
jgi:CBS domain-containing protein